MSLLDMLRFYADLFIKSLWEVNRIEGQWAHGRLDEAIPFPAAIGAKVTALQLDCIEYGLPNSAAKCDRIMEKCDGSERVTYREGIALLKDLRERIEDEFRVKVFLTLTVKEAELYAFPIKGWESVIDRFGDSVRDIEEMGKCLALSRYPAAVFHSMQVIEHGVIALGTWLDVGDRKTGWNATTKELQRIVKTEPKQRSGWEVKHFQFIEQMNAVCYALMTAWRHKIDHAAGRLVLLPGDFAPEIAEDIVGASRTFMRRLAAELPKDAKPKE